MPLFGGTLRTAGLFKVGDYYYFNDPNNAEINDWRFFENNTYLDLEKYNGSTWIQEFRFGIPYVTVETDQDITGVKTFDSFKFNITTTPLCEKGAMSWNIDEDVPQIGLGNDVCAQIPLENLMYVKNISGTKILNGTPIYVSNDGNSVNNNIEIEYADATEQDNCRKTLAVATQDIEDNEFGFVTTFGFVRDVDTDGYEEGDTIYVKAGGGYTNIEPSLPNSVTRLGFTTRGHQSNGKIFVNIQQQSIKEVKVDSGDLSIKTAPGYTWVVDQPTWQDLIMPITRSRLPVANYPALATFKGNLNRYTFDINDYVSFDNETLHDYKEGTTILLHVHGATNGVDVTNRTIKYQAEVTVGNDQYNTITGIGSVFTDTFIIDSEITIPANTPDRSGFYFDIGVISIEDMKMGSQICFDFKRITASGTAPSNDPFIITVGAHYLQDTNGSRQMLVK